MGNLITPGGTAAILQKYNFNFQKQFGQNFLIDPHVLDKIIRDSGITKEDTVIEVGPGIGTMTQALCENAGKVIAVEIDRNLIPILENDTLKDYDNVTVINEDILNVDIKKLLNEHGAASAKVVANLPYYITTPIILGLLKGKAPVESITVMVQKEVALRMQASVGEEDYSALSLAVQYYADVYYAANVPANCFIPRPGVGSAVVRLDVLTEPRVSVKDEELMFKLIRASFNQRRKTLMNGIKNSTELEFDRDAVASALEKIGKDVSVRGEKLSLADFAALSDALGS